MSPPVYVDPIDAVQAGLYAYLTGDAELMGLINGVHDEVPETAEMPYVTLRDMLGTEDSAHGEPGRRITLTLHTWTRARGNRPGNKIGARLVAMLARRQRDLDLHVAGHTVWWVSHEFHQNLNDPAPGIRHRVDRFVIRTTQDEEQS